jgi:hypothetical protein
MCLETYPYLIIRRVKMKRKRTMVMVMEKLLLKMRLLSRNLLRPNQLTLMNLRLRMKVNPRKLMIRKRRRLVKLKVQRMGSQMKRKRTARTCLLKMLTRTFSLQFSWLKTL